MREISASQITETVSRLFSEANYCLAEGVLEKLKEASEKEKSEAARDVLKPIIANAEIAGQENIPLCQDCGSAVVFLELGQEVRVDARACFVSGKEIVAERLDDMVEGARDVRDPRSG